MRLLWMLRSQVETWGPNREPYPSWSAAIFLPESELSSYPVCTTWHAALVDTSSLVIKEPKRRKLKKWFEEHPGSFARLDPEGRGVITPPFEEIEDAVRLRYLEDARVLRAREIAEKIAKAWGRGRRDKKAEKWAQVWYAIESTPEAGAPRELPEALVELALVAPVGHSSLIPGSRGFAVFTVSERDSNCAVGADIAAARTAIILANERRQKIEKEARALYEANRERYFSPLTYRFTYAVVPSRPEEITDFEPGEIEDFYQRHIRDFGTHPAPKVNGRHAPRKPHQSPRRGGPPRPSGNRSIPA